MDVDGSGSESGRSASAKSGTNSRTPPNCARCRNHKIKVPLQAHKRYCPFKDCACKDCILTKERQRVMALQTARRRAQTQDEIRERKLMQEAERIARGEAPSSTPSFSLPPTPNSSCIELENNCSCQSCKLFKERQKLVRQNNEERRLRGEPPLPLPLYNLPPSTPGSCIDVENSNMPSSGDEDTAGTPSPLLGPNRPMSNVYRPPGTENDTNGIIPNTGKNHLLSLIRVKVIFIPCLIYLPLFSTKDQTHSPNKLSRFKYRCR